MASDACAHPIGWQVNLITILPTSHQEEQDSAARCRELVAAFCLLPFCNKAGKVGFVAPVRASLLEKSNYVLCKAAFFKFSSWDLQEQHES